MSGPLNDEEERRWEAWRINREAAHRAHDDHAQDRLELFHSVIAFGLEAVRTSALINGGASVASIAFIGAIFESQPELAQALAIAILVFAGGVLASGLASGFAYFTQFFYERALSLTTLTFEHPYVFPEPRAMKWARIGAGFHIACALSVIASYALLIAGAYQIYSAVRG